MSYDEPLGHECGEGWKTIINDTHRKLKYIDPNYKIAQIKEKFGGLRFYIDAGSDEIYARISEAERLSYETCEVTGEPGKLRTDLGWHATLCDAEYTKRKQK